MTKSMYSTYLGLSIRPVSLAVTAEYHIVDRPLSTCRLDSLVVEFRRMTSHQDTGLSWGMGHTCSLLINVVIP